MNAKQHTAIYIRVSTDEQKDGYSLDAQSRDCRAFCAARGWTNTTIYADEGLSAFKDRIEDRPALQRLLDDVRAGRIQAVVVHKLDRFFRRVRLLFETIEEFERRGVAFVSYSEQMDFSTPIGRVMLANLGAFAEFYSRNLAEETRKGHREKACQGYLVGPVPIGYCKDEQGILQLSADAPIVLLIFELYASGQYSYLDVAEELNQRGHTIPNVQTGVRHAFGKSSVREILCNSVYRGKVWCSGKEYAGLHAPLIDEELWKAVQAIREPRARKGGRVSVRANGERGGLLTELAYCAGCGGRMIYQPGDGTQRRRHYYECTNRANWSTCDARMTWSEAVDTQLLDVVAKLAIPADWQEAAVAQAKELLAAQTDEPPVSRAEMSAEIERWGEVYARSD